MTTPAYLPSCHYGPKPVCPTGRELIGSKRKMLARRVEPRDLVVDYKELHRRQQCVAPSGGDPTPTVTSVSSAYTTTTTTPLTTETDISVTATTIASSFTLTSYAVGKTSFSLNC
jgi:hypothetical protein